MQQDWYRDYLAEDGVQKHSFVARFNSDHEIHEVASDIRNALGIDPIPPTPLRELE